MSLVYVESRQGQLASGRWLAFAGRESNPLDSIEKFPPSTSDFLLSQAYPDATNRVFGSLRLSKAIRAHWPPVGFAHDALATQVLPFKFP